MNYQHLAWIETVLWNSLKMVLILTRKTCPSVNFPASLNISFVITHKQSRDNYLNTKGWRSVLYFMYLLRVLDRGCETWGTSTESFWSFHCNHLDDKLCLFYFSFYVLFCWWRYLSPGLQFKCWGSSLCFERKYFVNKLQKNLHFFSWLSELLEMVNFGSLHSSILFF